MWIVKKQFYDNDDVQNMLNFLHYNKKALERFKVEIKDYSFADKEAMLYAISESWYEAFDRYDSAVCDYFIKSFERCFLQKEGIKQFEVIAKSGNMCKVIDYEDGVVDTLALADVKNAINMGISIKI